MMKQNNKDLIPLVGYDTRGVVYDAGEYILRKIFSNDFREAENIYKLYEQFNLKNYGIVKTKIDKSSKAFKHKKHIISYPYEWSANMFKDAALFYLGLLLKLDKHGLTLKDALPNNIVFDFCKPVFIDFLSLINKEKLKNEEWLTDLSNCSDARFDVFNKMFTPFILIPFMAMVKRDYVLARLLLSEKACSRGVSPSWNDLYPKFIFSQIFFLKTHIINYISYFLTRKNKRFSNQTLNLLRLLKSKHKDKFIEFNKRVLDFVYGSNVTPLSNGYASYYENKNEAFNVNSQLEWHAKQKNVYKVIKNIRPKRVLDIGANTGWFSILAEKLGAEVIATDIDESLIDTLYLYSKENKRKILPLLLSFNNLSKQFYCSNHDDPIYKDRNLKTDFLFLPATKRLKSDVVLLLALLHHLIIGQHKGLKEIFNILSILTKKVLIVEYVGLKDKVMDPKSSFFKNLPNYNAKNYNIDLVIEEGKKHFNKVEILNSNPSTRKLLVFKK